MLTATAGGTGRLFARAVQIRRRAGVSSPRALPIRGDDIYSGAVRSNLPRHATPPARRTGARRAARGCPPRDCPPDGRGRTRLYGRCRAPRARRAGGMARGAACPAIGLAEGPPSSPAGGSCVSTLTRPERLDRRRRRLEHEPRRPRVANEGCYRVVGYQLVANVDPDGFGDVMCHDAGTSVQPMLEPVSRHLWPVNRARALRSTLPLRSSPQPRPSATVTRRRRSRRTRRPARARAPDDGGPPNPVKGDAPDQIRGAATDRPEEPLRDPFTYPRG